MATPITVEDLVSRRHTGGGMGAGNVAQWFVDNGSGGNEFTGFGDVLTFLFGSTGLIRGTDPTTIPNDYGVRTETTTEGDVRLEITTD